MYSTRWESVESKICSGIELDRLLSFWRFKNKRIVFTNGCFDLMHPGHVEYLYKAADEGDVLIVGLNSDASVRRLKGEKRPIQNEKARATVLAGLGCVDGVVLFEEDTPLELIRHIKPNILVKGGDYEIEKIVGYKEVVENGGKVLTIPMVDGFSTSLIIDKAGI